MYPLPCKRWSCPRCGPRKLKRILARIHAGLREPGTCRFVTITSPGTEDPATSFRELTRRWKRVHQRILRRFGTFEYVAVVEAQPGRGAAHIHLVYRGPYIPQAWLSRAAAGSGFGPITHVRRLPAGIATYRTKDLCGTRDGPRGSIKDAMPRFFRRVRWSARWCPWTQHTAGYRWTQWWITNAPPTPTACSAERWGLTVAEVVGGGLGGAGGRSVRWVLASQFSASTHAPRTGEAA